MLQGAAPRTRTIISISQERQMGACIGNK